MGWFSDLRDGNSHWFSEQWKAVKDSPERLFLGAMTPVGTAVWSGITGKDWEPVMDAWGGPSADVYKSGEAKGINMDATHNSHRVARVVTAAGMAGALPGQGGGAGAAGSTGGTTGGAAPTAQGSGSTSGWQSFMNNFGGGGMGNNTAGDGGGFNAFNEAFQRGYDPEGYERRRTRQEEMALRMRQEARQEEAHALAMAQAREQEAQRRRTAAAMDRVRSMSTDGVVERGAGDLSAGGIQQVMASGYGGTTGTAAAQELGADSYREAQRGMRALGATAQAEQVAAQALGLAQNGPKVRKAKESELMGAAGDAMLAAGQVDGWVGMRGRSKSAAFDEAFNDARDQWSALPDDQRAALVAAKSKDKTFPGFGAFVHGTDTKGNPVRYMHYRTEGGKRLELDEDSVADIVALEAAMRVDPTRARAEIRKLKDDAKVAAMEMFKIGLEGAKLNNDVVSKTFAQDLAERKLKQDGEESKARIGLGWASFNQRKAELDRTHPVMSADDRKSLLKIEEAWYGAKDPVAKAELERQYQMTLSRASLGMGKVLGLPNARGGQKPLTIEDAMPFIEQLKADPVHKGKNVFELFRMVQAEMGGGAPEAFKVPGGAASPAPAAPGGIPQRPVSDGRTNFGILTSRADLEREAAAGNPHAIRYLNAQRENRINAELSAGNPNYGIDY